MISNAPSWSISKWDRGETINWSNWLNQTKDKVLGGRWKISESQTKVDHQAWKIMPQSWIRRKEVGWKKIEDRSLEEMERNGKKEENLP